CAPGTKFSGAVGRLVTPAASPDSIGMRELIISLPVPMQIWFGPALHDFVLKLSVAGSDVAGGGGPPTACAFSSPMALRPLTATAVNATKATTRLNLPL